MENENENNDSQIVDKDAIVIDENDDIDAVKEKFGKLSERGKKTSEDNKQLFARAKKAEGFELKDGDWIKIEKTEKKETSTKKEPEAAKPDDKLLEKMDRLTLKAESITEQDEVDLANQWKKDTGREVEDIISNPIFVKELEKLRDDKANEKATANVEGGGGTTQAKNTPEYWIAKGTPPSREDVPDRKTRIAIQRAMMASTKSGKKFYND